MHIEHVAIWTKDIEGLRGFYETYFQAHSGEKYINPKKQFESYFLEFESGARLELMHQADIPDAPNDTRQQFNGNHSPRILNRLSDCSRQSDGSFDTGWLQNPGWSTPYR